MSDQYLGEIRMFSGNYAPQGWAFCNGQILSVNENQALFSILGGTYGGDGKTTFALPDLRGRVPIHNGTSPQSGTKFAIGQKGGTETVTLTEAQLPAHTHTVNAQSAPGTNTNPTNSFWATSTVKEYSTAAPNLTMSAAAVSYEGANQEHDNMMPFFPVTFIIATQGLYPSQG
ncbi:phage tail protein [Cohnella zeiphila]|uniref:Phage tail protein n=1 Tax=Cohnella zeiphila TaxID=2761120 RepID=A0A7X0VXG3_9BACL|nr:tail fiber protein [Cohnella zeiphila]MBB6734244.1 phage tail protein [Cohnella zeiphila]